MSTRSQVIIKDEYDELWFYRHSDGYPAGNMPQLKKLIEWYSNGLIRKNVEQSSGWLVLIGADEYGYDYNYKTGEEKRKENLFEPSKKDTIGGWKVGAYEPCTPERHGDIEWLYIIDLQKEIVIVEETYTGKQKILSWNKVMNIDNWDNFEESEFD